MKLKYILGVVLSAFFIMGCSDDDQTMGTFGDLNVSQSYLSIPETGGDMVVTVKAAQAWKFDEIFQKITKNADGSRDTTYNALPDWLTADVLSGAAGETKVTFHADATSGGREAELQIVSAERTQFVVVRQGSMEASSATCAEVIAGNDGKTFRVKGTVTAIANTTYGNWYLDDGTGQIYIYGTLDAEGKTKNFLSLGIEVGDVVEVQGPKTTYNGTVELVDVTVLSITKSLVKVESAPVTVGKEGGDVEVKVAYKGSGALFAIPEADREWISFVDSKYIAGDADTVVFRFHVAANEGAGRKSDLTFSSANKSTSSEVTYTITQETGITNPAKGNGTKASPYNVTAVINYVKGLGADVKSENDVYVEGIISSIKYTYSAQFGTATYNISADGKEDNVFTVYGSYFYDGKPWEEGQTQIQVGDKVVVCGKVIDYKGTTPEFANKENWLVSLNGVSGGEGGNTEAEPGTLENPFTPAQASAFVAAMEAGVNSEAEYYIKGKVVSVAVDKNGVAQNFDNGTYGNASFYISEDGTEANQFYIFRTLYLGNKKWVAGAGELIKAGDEVIVCGKVVNYKGDTPETVANQSHLYSLNGKTE